MVAMCWLPVLHAWGGQGHRLVGRVAANHLSRTAAEKAEWRQRDRYRELGRRAGHRLALSGHHASRSRSEVMMRGSSSGSPRSSMKSATAEYKFADGFLVQVEVRRD